MKKLVKLLPPMETTDGGAFPLVLPEDVLSVVVLSAKGTEERAALRAAKHKNT